MQHLDEGTIHSWLDGALSADEAARVEAHVKECPQCAAAVAEARGFIAASSRILTALDNAPRGVIPAAAPGRRVDPIVWRIAATVMVVAAGTLVVFRNGVGTAKTDQAAVQTVPTASSVAGPEISMRDEGTGTTGAPATPATTTAKPSPTAPARALSRLSATEKRGAVGEVAASDQVARSRNVPAAPPAAQTFAQTSGAAAMDAENEQPQALKVVGTPRTIGAKVTLYEVARGDTVTLTEPTALQLQSSVVTGVAAGKAAAAAPMRRADAAAVSAPPVASANAQASRVESANGMTTITWLDPVTGNMLRLSGRMPAARLQEIRLRIERERAAAAAAAAKKDR
ncbi:MAG: zf-HC2 domain-containing protein [Gemmatimonadales bacterium]